MLFNITNNNSQGKYGLVFAETISEAESMVSAEGGFRLRISAATRWSG